MKPAPAIAPDLREIGPSDVVAIVGKRGTGKSTFAKALCATLVKQGTRACAFDYHDEYSRHGHASAQVRLGPLACRTTSERLGLDPSVLDAADLSLSVVPSQSPRDAAADFSEWVDAVLYTGSLVALADEVGVYGQYVVDDLNRLATQSRHSSVPLVFVAQRMTQIPLTARTQVTRLISFRQDNPHDLKAIAELVGADGKNFAARVARLARGQSVTWRDS